MKKRGQFYLIAALIIVGILVGLGAIYNDVRTSNEDTQVYDLSKEINFESSKVVDQGVFSGSSSSTIEDNIKKLIEIYSNSSPNNEIFVLYGNETEKKSLIYYKVENSGSTGISAGSGQNSKVDFYQQKLGTAAVDYGSTESGKIKIKLSEERDLEYTFDLEKGESFYIIVRKDKDAERFVAKND